MTKIRTRIAPSPTGDPHVGTAYIALFNRAFAKSQGGEFILRIEDTDRTRSTPESEAAILKSLKWLGLDWDEGPDCGGPHGPYRQSERQSIYQEHAHRLIQDGHAFHCFCTAERLDEMRKERQAQGLAGYDGHCMHLSEDEVNRRLADGEASVIRMKVPEEGICELEDELRGTIEIDWKQIDMQVLLKSDGMPTYHLACVVDDHLMEISHILRGEEWISSTPKQLLLYQYFGWEPPVFCHLPLLRNADKSKLSKRKNPTSIDYYHALGILPEALLNFLGMMGWTMPSGEEKFTQREMIDNFDVKRVSLGGPVFDPEKLDWLNGRYIREDHTPEQLMDRMMAWKYNREYVDRFLPMVQQRIERLSDAAPLAMMFFQGLPSINAASFEPVKLDEDELKKTLQLILWKLETQRHWNKDNVMADVKAVGDHLGHKMRDIMAPLFIAITGQPASVSVLDAMAILGPDMTRGRIRHAIEVLGGLGKKKLKSLEKEFQQIAAFMD
ncbi:glutamate--tRNA ligase [Saccharospirillum salsuginis]|uniref:Glutamate--tRNA ligase n=1 Tax=Saccharospirillum salsuginis TaxID=418750 RepID=A0A918KUR4_9GAMM|nr:glutamate--tRNA ligase [Saccharospirillum salsuginis]GGX74315.1 glutamate--tRNA ligase [Saccharospirillum salsuginis]